MATPVLYDKIEEDIIDCKQSIEDCRVYKSIWRYNTIPDKSVIRLSGPNYVRVITELSDIAPRSQVPAIRWRRHPERLYGRSGAASNCRLPHRASVWLLRESQ